MSFLVFLLILAFLTIFAVVSIQARRMALLGMSPWSVVPAFLAKKLSATAYIWACLIPGWIVIILAGMIYNADLRGPGGPILGDLFLGVLAILYVWLWLKNRSLELKH